MSDENSVAALAPILGSPQTMTQPYSQLHDGTFVSVALDWDAAQCTVLIRLRDGVKTLLWRNVTRIAVTKTQPWGPASSVNSLTQSSGRSYVLELQSGDLLEIDADELELR